MENKQIMAWIFIPIALFLILILFCGASDATVTISNVSPVNNSIHNEIYGNPPDPSGYINISFQLNDLTGGGDMEFYLDVWNGTAFINRLHLTDSSNDSWYHHEDENPFNETNQNCQFRINSKDHTDGVWTNETFNFRTDCKPDAPFEPTPANNSYREKGDITLSVNITHPDNSAGAKIYNVTFYEHPSGRVIGYNHTNIGWDNGTIVTCNSTFHLHYNGTKYYWFAQAKDDEYWGDNSSVWQFETYYNDSLNIIWYTMGASLNTKMIELIEPLNNSLIYGAGTPLTVKYCSVFSDIVTDICFWNGTTLLGKLDDVTPSTYDSDEQLYFDYYTCLWNNLEYDTQYNWSVTTNFTQFGQAYNNSFGIWSFYTPKKLINLWYTMGASLNTKMIELIEPLNNSLIYGAGTPLTVKYCSVFSDIVTDICFWNGTTLLGKLDDVTPSTYDSDEQLYFDYYTCLWNNLEYDTQYNWSVTTNFTQFGQAYNNSFGIWSFYTPKKLINLWYTMGAQIAVSYLAEFSNESPSNESIDIWCHTLVSIDVNCTTVKDWVCHFYTNYTSHDGGWVEFASDTVTTNGTGSVYSPMLDLGSIFYWYIHAVNTTSGRTSDSQIYHFTVTKGVQPNNVWYTMGANITVSILANITNPSPANGSTGIPINGQQLSVWINETGDAIELDVTFYTNHTHDGSWHPIDDTTVTVPPNATVYMPTTWDGLQYNTTYWWYVQAVNVTTGKQTTSETWHFNTTDYTDSQPSNVWYTLGADIYVEPLYTESQPDTLWYTMGADIPIDRPLPPSNPIPVNNTICGQTEIDFSVLVNSTNSSAIVDTIKFYWGDDTLIGTDTNVPVGDRATVHVSGLTNWTWFDWYAVVEDGQWTEGSDAWTEHGSTGQSETWRYRPANCLPTIAEWPLNKSVFVPVRRKLVAGEYQFFVRLCWTINDPDNSNMGFKLFVDDPSDPGHDDWVQRWTILEGVANGTYCHDEVWFNQTTQNYSWRLWLTDQYNTTTYQFWFETDFFFWADFNWTPYHPTDKDTITFIDLSANATDYNWSIDGVSIRRANYTSGSSVDNWNYQFNISNIYNVTLWVYNDTCENYDSIYKHIYVDRNITFNRTGIYAGYNYFGYHLNESTNASYLASLLNLSDGWWMHKYNKTLEKWESIWIGYTGDNFDVHLWNTMVIALNRNMKERVNITTWVNATQDLTLYSGYNYFCWSDNDSTTAANFTGLETGDWIHFYNTTSGAWHSYWIDYTGDDFPIHSYDIICAVVGGTRNLVIGG